MERQKRSHNLEKFLAKISLEEIAWPTRDLKKIKYGEINRFYIPNEVGAVTEFNLRATLESLDELLIAFYRARMWKLTSSLEEMFLTKVERKNKKIIAHWSTNGEPIKNNGTKVYLSDWVLFREKIEERNPHLV